MRIALALLLALFMRPALGADRPHLHLDIRGEGTPTVVLEAGFGGTTESWAKVQPEVAKFARVVAYDRAGVGRSERGARPRTAATIAHELRAALLAAKLRPPYVLVGHSAGGAYVRVFAHLYPREVAGLILIDPPQEEFLDWMKVHDPDQAGMPAERLAKMPEGLRAEWDARDAVIEEMRGAWPLPAVPMVLLTSARNDQSLKDEVSPDALEALLDARRNWLRRVPSARQIVAQKSGHDIPGQEPDLVTSVIRQVIEAKR